VPGVVVAAALFPIVGTIVASLVMIPPLAFLSLSPVSYRGTIVASLVMIPPLAFLSLTPFGKASQIGLVQVRFLA
jgi:hypothetical protein